MARRKRLRAGFSTGTAAAAAAKAALLALGGRGPERVQVSLPGGRQLEVKVAGLERLGPGQARAWVIKDAGDDPDVTNRAEIRARVGLLPPGPGEEVRILGGEGVGRVTRPGLPVEVGGPAINPVPRSMIHKALRQAWRQLHQGPLRVEVEISVPRGRHLARHTLNPRLGILGGISILGTTGLVKPFSHQAYTATIESGLSVARASGARQVALSTGGKSEKRLMQLLPRLPEVAFIQIADFFGFALEATRRAGMDEVYLGCFFGKAVKQAQGLAYTHAHKAPLDLAPLAAWLEQNRAHSGLVAEVAGANTARHALEILKAAGRLDAVSWVGEGLLDQAAARLGPGVALEGFILDHGGMVLFHGRREGRR